VNAVLRSISRARGDLPLPRRPDTDPTSCDGGPSGSDADVARAKAIDYLSVTLSHPRWLVERWLDRFGFEATEAWLKFNNAPAPLTLRTNRLRLTSDDLISRLASDGISVRRGAFAPDSLIVETGHPLRGDGLALGWFVVQDEASQLVAQLANPRPGSRVLDACASPGGKTTAMAAMMGGTGWIVASDLRPRRLQLLRRTIDLSGAANVIVVRADLLRPLPFTPVFDLVVVDAPCSGLGTLRRDPDIRWRRSEDDLPPLAAAALTMLQHAGDAVAPGGRLVYSTCSSEPEENEGVVGAFLAGAPGFAPLDAHAAAPSLPADVIDDRGWLRTQPHHHGLEAFFGAVFEKRG
jgi:16S rRNA (cytosine967-C5)-methyltransferase